jgi:xanthine dehydrogenase YagS FAD-binding subunit
MNVLDFFQVRLNNTTVLDPDEIVTEIHIPMLEAGTRSAFIKFAQRKSIDFPIVNCAAALTLDKDQVTGARICLNAVHVIPRRVLKAEEAITGKTITAENAGGRKSSCVRCKAA